MVTVRWRRAILRDIRHILPGVCLTVGPNNFAALAEVQYALCCVSVPYCFTYRSTFPAVMLVCRVPDLCSVSISKTEKNALW